MARKSATACTMRDGVHTPRGTRMHKELLRFYTITNGKMHGSHMLWSETSSYIVHHVIAHYRASKFNSRNSTSHLQREMPTSTLAIDGLWQCLCPSFSRATLTNATYVSRISRRPALQCLSSSTPAARRHASDQTHTQAALELHQPFISDAETEFPSAASDNAKFLSFADVGALGPAQPRNYVGKKRTTPLIRLSTPFLYELLRKSAGKGETAEVQQIVEHLIGEREEQPNLRLYASLILVNVNPRDGAAWRVANLLEEMKNEGLQMDVGVGHDVLKVSCDERHRAGSWVTGYLGEV